MVDSANAVWIPNSNFFPNTGKKSFIICHGTAGGSSAQGIATYFQGTQGSANPVSSHYIVGKDGTVVQTVAEKDGAFGNGVVNNPNWAGNPNYYTISIEHVKSSNDNSEPLTPAQQSASFALIKDICQRNGIGMHDADDTTGITGHFAIDPINRARCPGTFDWDALWTYLTGNQPEEDIMIDLNNPTVASHFTTDGSAWKCTNGFSIHGEILEFYKQYGGMALCGLSFLGLPLTLEVPISSRPGVVYQRYERGVLIYDPLHVIDMPPGLEQSHVYPMHIDSGLGQDPRVSTLQSENGKLKALLASSNLGQISTLGKQIADDVALIMKLTTVQ